VRRHASAVSNHAGLDAAHPSRRVLCTLLRIRDIAL
jgi:hypothetical protein